LHVDISVNHLRDNVVV